MSTGADVIDKSLECQGGVAHAEEHDFGLI